MPDGSSLVMRQRPPAAPVVTITNFFSPNKKFRLTVEDPPWTANRLMRGGENADATMSEMVGGAAIIRWTSKFPSRPVHLFTDSDFIIADDGSYFLAAFFDVRTWFLMRPDRPPRMITNTAQNYRPSALFDSTQSPILDIDKFNGSEILRLWDREEDRWDAFSIKDDKKIEVTPELTTRWNAATRERILSDLTRARTELMRKSLGKISKRLENLAAIATDPDSIRPIRETDYEFLALRRHPEDRLWFEHLVEGEAAAPIPKNWRSGFLIQREEHDHFINSSGFRARGDWLLAIHDGKMTKQRKVLNERTKPRFYVADISGTVKLPVPVLGKKGEIRIYLVPEERGGKDWTNIIIIPENELGIYTPQSDYFDELSFTFPCVAPGQYRVKALWDKRPGFWDIAKAGPGDYESDWSPPIIATAGQSITNIVLDFSRRAEQGETYYQADQAAATKWRNGELSVFLTKATGATFSAPIAHWITKTNKELPGKESGFLKIELQPRILPPNVPNLPLLPELVIISRAGRFREKPTSLRILDEHGCIFESTATHKLQQSIIHTFRTFPRTASEWRLVGLGKRGHDHILFDYALTNLVLTKPSPLGTLQTLPLEVQIGNVAMRVTRVANIDEYNWIEASFTEEGQPTEAWWPSEVQFLDPHENPMDPEKICKEMNATKIFGRISRKAPGSNESRRFEFTIPRWKPYAEKD